MTIHGTTHQPPAAGDVPELVEEMCDYMGANWHRPAIHLAAYTMWRVNWIRPFMGGNGRTSRAVSYLTLCARLGYNLPGPLTIPEQIVADRQHYYTAPDAGDDAWTARTVDVSAMEDLLSQYLAAQLLSVHSDATGKAPA